MNHREFIAAFADVPLEISAAVPTQPMRVSEILDLRIGSVVGTTVPAGETIHLYTGAARIGAGTLYKNGARLRVRIVAIGAGR